MANTSSARKAARKILHRTFINKSRRSRVSTFIRKVETALSSGNQDGAFQAFRSAESELMRAAQKGVIHRKTASRKVSRLSRKVKLLNSSKI